MTVLLKCPGCHKSKHKILSLLRPPRPPHEKRVCDRCKDICVAAGMTVMSSMQTTRSADGVASRCADCGDRALHNHVVSSVGEPLNLNRCEECAKPLLAEDWRAASVVGVA
jgi:hypothetical protein